MYSESLEIPSRNQTKTLLGIETEVGCFWLYNYHSRNQTKTLLGIETVNQLCIATKNGTPQSN